MDLETLRLKALVHCAEKIPEEALPHLGTLAHLGLWLRGLSRRRFYRGITRTLGDGAASRRRGMQQLLGISELDYEMREEAVREANRLCRAMSPVDRGSARKFFIALRKATVLQDYYALVLDAFEPAGEDVLWSIFDGSAFLNGGVVSQLIEPPTPRPEVVPRPATPSLTAREGLIVTTLTEAGHELKAAAIARRSGCSDNSSFRATLSSLFKRGILTKGVAGYGLPEWTTDI